MIEITRTSATKKQNKKTQTQRDLQTRLFLEDCSQVSE